MRRGTGSGFGCAAIAAVLTSFWALPADAYPLPDGRVVWDFEGTVTEIVGINRQDISICCEIEFGLGAPVVGTLTFAPGTYPIYVDTTLSLDVGTPSVGHVQAFGWAESVDSATTDALNVTAANDPNLDELIHLRPGFRPIVNTWYLALADSDGEVFDGAEPEPRTLSLPPAYAPAAELFETRWIGLFFLADVPECGGTCPYPQIDGYITIQIDRFPEPVPEPGAALLVGGAALALGAARRAATAARRD